MLVITKLHLLRFSLIFMLMMIIHQNTQAVEEDSRVWQSLIAEGNINQNLRWYAEIQGRWKDDVKLFDQAIFRPAINYALSDKSSLWIGYAYVETKTSSRHTHEDRWWQQFQYISKFNDVTWLTRTRLEQRNLDNGENTSYRIRQQLRASRPIKGSSDLSYLVWDEFFCNLNDTHWAGESGFNQNRLFTGIMWKYTNKSRLEIGYLNQYINVSNSGQDQLNHTISSTIFIEF